MYIVGRGQNWFALGGIWSVWGVTGWYLVVLGQYRAVLVGTWWNWAIRWQYWSIHDGTGSVWRGNGSYMMVLGQCGSILVGTWWNWISIRQKWLILGQ